MTAPASAPVVVSVFGWRLLDRRLRRRRLLRQEPDGSLVDHADLRELGAGLNELVVDGRGNIYVNGGTNFHPGEGEAPGFVALVTPDGAVRRVDLGEVEVVVAEAVEAAGLQAGQGPVGGGAGDRVDPP